MCATAVFLNLYETAAWWLRNTALQDSLKKTSHKQLKILITLGVKIRSKFAGSTGIKGACGGAAG